MKRLSPPAIATMLGAGAAALALSPAAANAHATSAKSTPRVTSCEGKRLTRPSGVFVLSCADANSELKDTHWSSWTSSEAKGTTTFGLNLCTPNCASSKIKMFPDSSVRLYDVKSTADGPLFTKARILYTLKGKQQSFTASLRD